MFPMEVDELFSSSWRLLADQLNINNHGRTGGSGLGPRTPWVNASASLAIQRLQQMQVVKWCLKEAPSLRARDWQSVCFVFFFSFFLQ